jgi:hypothetical protein
MFVDTQYTTYDYILIGISGIGIFFNLILIRIFLRKAFNTFNQRNSYIFSLIVDTFNAVILIIAICTNRIQNTMLYCKIFLALIYILPAYSAWTLVYISIERLVRTIYPTSKINLFLKKQWFHVVFLMLILVVCFFYYTPTWYNYSIRYYTLGSQEYAYYLTEHNNTIGVCYVDPNIQEITYYINMIFSCIIPFIFLICCSLLLIYSIRLLRLRIPQNENSTHTANSDKQFAMTILFLDLFFLLLYFPYNFLNIYCYFYNTTNIQEAIIIGHITYVLACLYYLSFSVNIIVYSIINKMFRDEFIKSLREYCDI